MDITLLWLSALSTILFRWKLDWFLTLQLLGQTLEGPYGQPDFYFLKDDDVRNPLNIPLEGLLATRGPTHPFG
ncbi:hypothetical protein MA16_Dca028250 [Dendrobium catenatum]|uniref:Chlorophyll a-b binding protein, chloroplastic n=1 Tax=Dendrobium catenatum TaxID=906689 RepID=A0A2I0VC99_9ASPA|nr:hypothetical protein MA16_Dca028250 [Dendrobium catenatum]